VGLIRLFLALVVAIDHLRDALLLPVGLNIPAWPRLGMNAGYAVMFFYMISGFLISTGLSRKYPPDRAGTLAFYQSRFIRIFSLYWPMALGTTLLLGQTQAFWQADVGDKFTSTFLLGADWRVAFANYPASHFDALLIAMHQAWTLGAELTFYVLAPFILRSPRLAVILFGASALTRAFMVHRYGFSDIWTYYFAPSTFLFFLLGHFAREAGDKWAALKNLPVLGCGLVAVAILSLIAPDYAGWDSPRFWISATCFAASLPSIFEATHRSRLLTTIGDLSYTVYLVHVVCLIYVADFFPNIFAHLVPLGEAGALIGAVPVLAGVVAIAAAVHWIIERPVGAAMRSVMRGTADLIGYLSERRPAQLTRKINRLNTSA